MNLDEQKIIKTLFQLYADQCNVEIEIKSIKKVEIKEKEPLNQLDYTKNN